MKPVSDDIRNIIRNIFNAQHPLLAEIIINWAKIVGLKFSRISSPVKVGTNREKGVLINTLYIEVENGSILIEMSFQQEIIMERIAVYLGFKAIHQLRFRVHKYNANIL
jgi:hypothetical protein